MQIVVVNPGESVAQIANRYGVTTESIVRLNELDQPANLVPGQALVVPIVGSYYTIRQGDSFYSIARQHGVSLLTWN